MAEQPATAAGEERGRPYYEKLRSDLKATLEKKRELDRTMANIEESIALKETAYLEETQTAGNIIKGFDNYMKASTTSSTANTGGGTSTRRKGGITEADKIFSRSSTSWTTRDAPAPTLTLNLSSNTPSERATPVVASARETPSASAPINKGLVGTRNKKKVTLDDAEESERPTKRGKVSWNRD